ncbi:hypothetical protein [Streptomyces iconiensis]|uniref:Secreted protein n=1 Tax=Streptomyces iconiensis TaxID=1384038 RepID=A0ABT7A0P7_9ACTN|nr:hypothetical protein [Streptomyces iconiensis]MDJ1134894.1 hypothetical protein [Streptomyces iconiensis]
MTTDPTAHGHHTGHASHADHVSHADHGAHAGQAPGGLLTSAGGYTLELRTPQLTAGTPGELRFAVVQDSTGEAVTAYRTQHGKELHLIVASRDLTVYRHLHPTRAADGTWSTPVELPKAGAYRVFADFAPEGSAAALTLGADLTTGGVPESAPLPEPHHTAHLDGYEVRLAGTLRAGEAGHLTLRVAREGRPVRDLQPYLGAYGHLVALRSGDLAYLHVHPHGEPGDGLTQPGPDVSFMATVPSAGAYRLFFDFQHEGVVRTAAFTVRTEGADAPAPGAPAHADHANHGQHADHGQHAHHVPRSGH